MLIDRLVALSGPSHVLMRHVGLWVILLTASWLVVIVPDIPVSFPSPFVAVALATLAAVVALALFAIGQIRFHAFGRLLDLFAGLAFGALAFTNVVVRIPGLAVARETSLYAVNLHLILLAHVVSSSLFLMGLHYSDVIVEPRRRRWLSLQTSLGEVAILALGTAAVLSLQSILPGTLDAEGRRILEAHVVIGDFLGGQASWVLVSNAIDALLLLLASFGYLRLGQRTRESHFVSLASALTFLFFSQLHAFLFPPVTLDYVSTSDGFRLAAYVVLIASLGSRISGEITEHAKADERLRLSRELHDGLMQQLSLVNLRLSRAVEPERPPERRHAELEAVMRILEATLLEARQVITSLRTGTVTWEELTRAIGTYAEELAQNHELRIEVTCLGSTPPLAIGLQIELLRILQEAVSNAARHGAATSIDVALDGSDRGLALRIRDNGCGFDPARAMAGDGIGLRSFQERLRRREGTCSIDSAPGRGAAVHIFMPLVGQGV